MRAGLILGLLAVIGPAAGGDDTQGAKDEHSPAPAAPAPAPAPAPPAERAEDSGAAAKKKAPSTAEEIWADLVEGNRRFVEGRPRERELVKARKQLAKGQLPKVIVLGCADSRVPPTLVFDKSLGDLFEVRIAGNIADPLALGSIEYAVEHLHSPVLVVLGHEKCGAVAAAAAGGDSPTANLEAIVQKIAPALEEVNAASGSEERRRRLEEANIHRSARDLIQASPIVHRRLEEGKLTIFKAHYRLETGEVIRLD